MAAHEDVVQAEHTMPTYPVGTKPAESALSDRCWRRYWARCARISRERQDLASRSGQPVRGGRGPGSTLFEPVLNYPTLVETTLWGWVAWHPVEADERINGVRVGSVGLRRGSAWVSRVLGHFVQPRGTRIRVGGTGLEVGLSTVVAAGAALLAALRLPNLVPGLDLGNDLIRAAAAFCSMAAVGILAPPVARRSVLRRLRMLDLNDPSTAEAVTAALYLNRAGMHLPAIAVHSDLVIRLLESLYTLTQDESPALSQRRADLAVALTELNRSAQTLTSTVAAMSRAETRPVSQVVEEHRTQMRLAATVAPAEAAAAIAAINSEVAAVETGTERLIDLNRSEPH